MSQQRSALAQRLAKFFGAQTIAELVPAGTQTAPAKPVVEVRLLQKRKLVRQLLGTLSPVTLAETGYLERRGADRSKADPRSLRAARLRRAAAQRTPATAR